VTRFITTRLLHGVVTVYLVATAVFFLVRLAPGDPMNRGADRPMRPELRSQLERLYGLDRPLLEQYARYLRELARGNLGASFSERRPVLDAFRDRIPNTILLALAALLVDFAVGIAVGAFQGTRAGSRSDTALSVTTIMLYSMPVFWFGIMLILVFALGLGWFPASGAHGPLYAYASLPSRIVDRIHHLVLPAATLGLIGAASTARYQRAAMIDVVRLDFVRFARSKGVPERLVVLRHALRNALLPVITLFGLSFPVLLSGSVFVESVFSWPGLGRFVADSVAARDYPVLTAAAMIASVMVVMGNLLADLAYRAVDPRTRVDT
jgi:peptide/nickel transport system permease protein